MDRLVKKFAAKLIAADLAGDKGDARPLVGGLDDALVWNRSGSETGELEKIFAGLSINSLAFLRPKEHYATLIGYLADRASIIAPKDCETRTFLHDLPVVHEFEASVIIETLKRSKSVIVAPPKAGPLAGPVIIAHGTVSPEQGFVVASSVCFACFVKFFADYLELLQTGRAKAQDHAAFDAATRHLEDLNQETPQLMTAPFNSEEEVYKALAQAGRKTVSYHLVDSYFGNISYCWNDTLYISQTGSSLDELAGCVDPVPLDGSSSAALTASSELTAHLEAISRTGCRAILHGHPKFSVIMSMDCPPTEKAACGFNGQCHIKCPKPRFVEDIPIVPGEVGTGPTGLCRTLPPALEKSRGAIVYGHGLFTTGRSDFNEAFGTLVAVESMCRQKYFEKVRALRSMS
jgi:ribulose-5-phosphate 4-epimerase/fuculose-1-phosphate aldolase